MRGVDTYLALKEQSDLFTPRALADLVSGDFLAFNSEGLSGNQQVINSRAIRRQAMQARAFSAMGTVEAGGQVEFTASNFVLDKLLPLIFHSKTGDVGTAAGATYTLVDGGVLTPFTTFVGLDGPEGEYTRVFEGCKINRATLAVRVNEMLSLSTEIAAINKRIVDAVATPVYPGGDQEFAYVFSNGRVQLQAGDMGGLAELPVENFEVNINHNLAVDKYRVGSVYRRSLQEGQTQVDGSFTIDAAAQKLAGAVLNLTGGATHDPAFFERIAREAKFARLVFDINDPSREVVAGAKATLTLTLPFVRLMEPDFNVREGGLITGTARFEAYDSITVTHRTTLTPVVAPVTP